MICARKDGDDSVTQPIESADRIRQPINKRPKPMKNQVQNDELGWTKSLADITGHLCACVCVTCVCVCVCQADLDRSLDCHERVSRLAPSASWLSSSSTRARHIGPRPGNPFIQHTILQPNGRHLGITWLSSIKKFGEILKKIRRSCCHLRAG